MEIIGGVSRWELTVRREADHIVILRAATPDERAVLPEELFGLPVTVLGDHALAPTAKPTEGERVRIIRGGECIEPDNSRLKELTLPRLLERVEDYALLNCRSLTTLHLWDGVRFWGGGALMNCSALNRFFLTRTEPLQGPSLALFADESANELDVTVREYDGSMTRLIFPDFVESYEENGPAHHFDYKIYGAGHPYHHVFRQKQFAFADYDNLWPQYLREEYEADAALRLAWYRLRYPTGLSEAAAARYWDYLREHAGEILRRQLEDRDPEGLELLLKTLRPSGNVLGEILEQTRRLDYAEGMALLLRENGQTAPKGYEKSFDL